MTTRSPILCRSCAHYNRDGTCAAFPAPERIPDAILFLGGDHRRRIPGDHGIVYAPAAGPEAAEERRAWLKYAAPEAPPAEREAPPARPLAALTPPQQATVERGFQLGLGGPTTPKPGPGYIWLGGKWQFAGTTLITDTGDGVPDSLDLPPAKTRPNSK